MTIRLVVFGRLDRECSSGEIRLWLAPDWCESSASVTARLARPRPRPMRQQVVLTARRTGIP